jgi:hypothetical protein
MRRLTRLVIWGFASVGLLALPARALASSFSIYTTESAFTSAVSTTLVEDFESVSPKDAALATLTHNGLTYTPFAGSPTPNVFVSSPGYTNYGAGVPQPTTTSILTANGDEDFLVTLAAPTLAVGFDRYLNGLGPATVRYYSYGTLVVTVLYASNTDDQGYLGLVSSDPITSFRWTTTLGGRLNTGIDNIRVGPPVPEPAPVLLVGCGLVLLGVRRWARS